MIFEERELDKALIRTRDYAKHTLGVNRGVIIIAQMMDEDSYHTLRFAILNNFIQTLSEIDAEGRGGVNHFGTAAQMLARMMATHKDSNALPHRPNFIGEMKFPGGIWIRIEKGEEKGSLYIVYSGTPEDYEEKIVGYAKAYLKNILIPSTQA